MIDWLGSDWFVYFYPALQAFLNGNNPYINSEIGNPPWTFLILSPLGFMSPTWSLIGINVISITGLVTLFYRYKRRWLILPLVISYPFLALLVYSNIDGLILWGLAVGGPIGMILLSTKPQAAILVGVIWVIKAWKKGGLKAVAILLAPLTALAAIMTALYPDWVRNIFWFTSRTDGVLTNGFPWLVPLGIGLFIAAVRREREDWAAIATILISPYVRVHSWIIALSLLALSYPLEGSIVALSTWLVYLKVVLAR